MRSSQDQLPRIVLEFETPEDRQPFLNAMIEGVVEQVDHEARGIDKPSLWRHVKHWRLGGSR